MGCGFSQRQMCLMKQLRMLWEQHVYWTRFFIISTAEGLNDLDEVTKRLLRNPRDFASVLCSFYGRTKANRFETMFTQHLLIAGDLVNAAKDKNVEKVNETRKRWYDNADEIAEFLSCINSCGETENWRSMLYAHLKMTEQEAVLRLDGRYSEDIQIFDAIEVEALKMADQMWKEIGEQFCL